MSSIQDSRLRARACRSAFLGALVILAGCDGGPAPSGTDQPAYPLPVQVWVTPATATLRLGDTVRFRGGVQNYRGDTSVTWQSLNPQVATVSPTGLVRGVTAGTAIVVGMVAADPGIRSSASVTVTQ
jgi:hypothetical protein